MWPKLRDKKGRLFSFKNFVILFASSWLYIQSGLEDKITEKTSRLFLPHYIEQKDIPESPVNKNLPNVNIVRSFEVAATDFYFKEIVEKKAFENMNKEEIIKYVDDPIKARAAIMYYHSRNGGRENQTLYSFREIHDEKKTIDCSEASVIAASTLSDDGFGPIILELKTEVSQYSLAHMSFIYKMNYRFGYIDNSELSEPRFSTINDLVEDMERKFELRLPYRRLIDLNKEGKDWIDKIPIK